MKKKTKTSEVKVLALIPARAGSLRIPHKNIYPLQGHPLLAYTIAAARGSAVFSDILVSTDSELYAEISRHYKAEVPFLRPASIAGAQSTDFEWLQYTLKALKKNGREYDYFSILRPTSPFRQPATIRRAWQLFKDSKYDSIRAVQKCGEHPYKMWTVEKGRLKPLHKKTLKGQPAHSCQYASLPPVYVQNASLEIARVDVVLKQKNISGKYIGAFFTEGFEGLDVNQERDLRYAEYLIESGKAKLPVITEKPYESILSKEFLHA